MVMAHFVENFWVREGCWKLCGFRSPRLFAPDLGLRALRAAAAAAAAPRTGRASSDRAGVLGPPPPGPAWMKPGGRRVTGRPGSQARSPCGGRRLSARPLSPRRGRRGAARRQRWDKAPDGAGDGIRPCRRLGAPGALRGRPQLCVAGDCWPDPAEGLSPFPHRSPPS